MKIELLFPEVCGLYGDAQNYEYLKKSLPDAEFIVTDFLSTPYFFENDPDIICIGSMSEEMQRKVLDKFRPRKDRINELIEKGQSADFEQILADIKERDERDSSRAIAPLKPADDAILFNNTGYTPEQSLEELLSIAKDKLGVSEVC